MREKVLTAVIRLFVDGATVVTLHISTIVEVVRSELNVGVVSRNFLVMLTFSIAVGRKEEPVR